MNHAILTDGHEVNQPRNHVPGLNMLVEGVIHNQELLIAADLVKFQLV